MAINYLTDTAVLAKIPNIIVCSPSFVSIDYGMSYEAEEEFFLILRFIYRIDFHDFIVAHLHFVFKKPVFK